MPDLCVISQAIDYIEGNLRAAIAVSDMADAVSYSLYHFCRTFNQVTHHSPYNYLIRRRLNESVQDLLRTDRRLVDIAFDYQFNSHETFSRAFKRMFGVQPSQSRKQGGVDRRRLLPRLTLAHLQHIAKGTYLKPVLEEQGPVRLAGMMALVGDDQSVIPQIWELFTQELGRDESTTESGDYYGIITYPGGWQDRRFLYMAAVEIQEQDPVNAALVVKTIPSLKCARFIHKGPMRDLELTLDYVYHTWWPKSGKCLSYPLVIERYGQDSRGDDSASSESEICIPID